MARGDRTNSAKAQAHDALYPLLAAMSREFKELSKKKPDAPLSLSKVKMVNRLLEPIHEVIKGEPARPYLDLLDEDAVPQNSDVVLILSQVVAAMDAFKDRYHYWDGTETR